MPYSLITEFIIYTNQGIQKSYLKSPGKSPAAQTIKQRRQWEMIMPTIHRWHYTCKYKHKYLVLMSQKKADYSICWIANKC